MRVSMKSMVVGGLVTVACFGAIAEGTLGPEKPRNTAAKPGESKAATEPGAVEKEIWDVVLLVDGSSEMAPLSRKSAHVVTEAMTDAHRLAIMTFGEEVRVLQTLSRIATIDEKAAALRTLTEAAFDAGTVSLRLGLTEALAHLEKRSTKVAHKVVVLLSGAQAEGGDAAADIEAVKSEIAPLYLSKGVVLHVVTLPSPQVDLLQAAASLTEGKCLAAVNASTMTDALDVIVDRLKPPETVVITQEVPVIVKGAAAAKKGPSPEKRLESIKRDTKSYFITGSFAAVIILLLVVVLFQLQALKRGAPSRADDDKTEKKREDKSGFAKLRDMANSLSNLIVDAKEMSEALNLDLEDFGVETWKEKKAQSEKYRELAKSIFLVIDHLEVQSEGRGEGARWVAEKLMRILDEEGIEEIPVAEGDTFDGLFHKHTEERDSDLKPGVVLDVMRKGYLKRGSDKPDDVMVLRQAEVAVSRGTNKAAEAASKGKEA